MTGFDRNRFCLVYPGPFQGPLSKGCISGQKYILCRYGNDFKEQWHIKTAFYPHDFEIA